MKWDTVLIATLIVLSSVTIGLGMLSAIAHRRSALQKRLREMSESPAEGSAASNVPLTGLLTRIGRLFSGSPSSQLRERLARAGYYGGLAPAVYLGAKAALLIAGMSVGCAALLASSWPLQNKIAVILMAGAVPSFLPNLFVGSKRRERVREVRTHLPDAMDLLEVCVSSGMGLDTAWNSVTEQIRRVSPVLADEMALTNLEMHLGASRAAAMRHMASRTGADELTSLVGLLVQSERFGASISETLKTYAQSIRLDRGHQAQEAVEKMAVKLLFPMVLFIFPSVLVVIVGPAALRLYQMFAGK